MYGPIFNYIPSGTHSYPPAGGYGAPYMGPMQNGGKDVFSLSNRRTRKSQGVLGAIKDFGTGIIKGGVNAVKSLFTPRGLALALGTGALVAFFPAVMVPLLIAAGLGIGGFQMAKGITSGNWEKAGEGAFTVGATLVGAKFGPKTVKGANGSTFTVAKPESGVIGTTLAHLKSLLGGQLKGVNTQGQAVSGSIYQIARESFSPKWSSLQTNLSEDVVRGHITNFRNRFTGKPQVVAQSDVVSSGSTVLGSESTTVSSVPKQTFMDKAGSWFTNLFSGQGSSKKAVAAGATAGLLNATSDGDYRDAKAKGQYPENKYGELNGYYGGYYQGY